MRLGLCPMHSIEVRKGNRGDVATWEMVGAGDGEAVEFADEGLFEGKGIGIGAEKGPINLVHCANSGREYCDDNESFELFGRSGE